jgi:hypothetical protein
MMSVSFETAPTDSELALMAAKDNFDASLADRYERLDTSLTKAERKYAQTLPNAARRAEIAAFHERYPTLPERLKASLTESTDAPLSLPEDFSVSVDEGRKVLVGILERRKLTGQKVLNAAPENS